jgi:hypothetical protein
VDTDGIHMYLHRCGAWMLIRCSKYILFMFIFYFRFCDFIDPLTAADDPESQPRNTDALVLCISNTGIFLLQSAINIFVVIIYLLIAITYLQRHVFFVSPNLYQDPSQCCRSITFCGGSRSTETCL